MSKLKVDELRSADRSVSDSANIALADDGKVGIGTTAPSETLHIEGTTSDVLIKNTGSAAVKLYGDCNTSSDEGFLMDISGRWNGTRVGVIGITAGPDTTNKDDGSIVFYTASPTLAERMRVDHSGNVGIGTTAPANLLHLKTTTTAGNIRTENDAQFFTFGTVEESSNDKFIIAAGQSGANEFILSSGGALYIRGALTQNSDERLKTNVETISSALSKVEQMRGVSYERIDNDDNTVGVIAQELETIAPELVNTATDPTTIGDITIESLKSVCYANLTAYLIEAIKELSVKVTELENK